MKKGGEFLRAARAIPLAVLLACSPVSPQVGPNTGGQAEGGSEQPGLWLPFESHYYTIQYPSGWRATGNSSPTVHSYDLFTNGRESVFVSVEGLREKVSLSDRVESLMQEIEDNGKGKFSEVVELPSNRPLGPGVDSITTVSSYEAKVLRARKPEDASNPLSVSQEAYTVVFLTGDQEWRVTLTTDPVLTERMLPVLKRMTESLKVTEGIAYTFSAR